MAPKNNNKKQKEEIKKKKLQAVVLTDDFETKFMPLTATTPRCLLRLGNVPLIEYTLEFLASADVNEVYLMCSGTHVELIQNYIKQSKWSVPWSPFKVQCLVSLEARSIGDVMRDLDNRSIITEDFVLISGDVICNVNFEDAMKYHKKIRESDRDHIVTMIMTEATSNHRSRPYNDDASVFVLNESNNKCLYFDSIPPLNGRKSAVHIDPELIENVDDFIIRNDLIDCHIDICTPAVPAIYSENFDFQHIRKDFLKGILTFDLLKRSFYVYIAEQGYGARVSSYSTFKAITEDLIERFVYPIVPELNFYENVNLKYESNHIYKDEKIVLAQSCKIGSNTIIGADTFINDRTAIEGSVIGANVKIGKNCLIKNSIIFNDVEILDNVIVENSFIGDNVIIRNNVKIKSDSVIGSSCVIDDEVEIPQSTKIIKHKPKEVHEGFFSSGEDENSDEEETASVPKIEVEKSNNVKDEEIVGSNGIGFKYLTNTDHHHHDKMGKDVGSAIYGLSILALSDDSISSTESSSKHKRKSKKGHHHSGSFSKSSNLSLGGKSKYKNRSFSATSQITNEDSNYNPEEERQNELEEFDTEAIATIERAIDNDHDLDTAVLELNTLRMSMNVTYSRVRNSTLLVLISKISIYVNTNTLKVKEATAKIFEKWGKLFKRQVFDKEDEIDLLDNLNTVCENLKKSNSDKLLNINQLQFHIMNQFYEIEICDEDNIIEWYETRSESPESTIDNDLVEKFIEWLQSAEEESSGEEEEEEEEDSSEEE